MIYLPQKSLLSYGKSKITKHIYLGILLDMSTITLQAVKPWHVFKHIGPVIVRV